MWYKIDFNKLIILLLPTFLRKSILFGFIRSIIEPIVQLHDLWYPFRERNLERLSFNSQKCYLQKAVNYYVGVSYGTITIKNNRLNIQEYIYREDEDQTVYLGTLYVNTGFSTGEKAVSFLVNVPKSYENDIERKNIIKATLDFYKLAGTSYEIIYT